MASKSELLVVRPVLVSGDTGVDEGEFSVSLAETTIVLTDKLREELSRVIGQVTSLFAHIDREASTYEAQTIEVTLQITAEGKLGILGSSIGGQSLGGIRITFKKRSPHEAVQ